MPRPKYIFNVNADLTVLRGYSFQEKEFLSAIEHAENVVKKLAGFEVDIFRILGMRNLSAFVGELFAAAMISQTQNAFRKNPHQDGYPDMLLMDKVGTLHWNTLLGQLRDKRPFSPFITGGVEIKATCGTVPTDAVCIRRGAPGKPDIGDQRIDLMTGYDWKAHHRDTNYLMGIVWDFIDKLPAIVGVFYCRQLNVNHWGNIIQPREGGGRTTSVSIMTRDGVATMYRSWICVRNDPKYINFFNKHNRGQLLLVAN